MAKTLLQTHHFWHNVNYPTHDHPRLLQNTSKDIGKIVGWMVNVLRKIHQTQTSDFLQKH